MLLDFVKKKENLMIKWRLFDLIGRVMVEKGERVSYRQIADATGLSKSTVALIATGKATRTDLQTIGVLLRFFSNRLGFQVTPNDLLMVVDGEEG
jgi:DNA-binding Xre family transcriptional regulator